MTRVPFVKGLMVGDICILLDGSQWLPYPFSPSVSWSFCTKLAWSGSIKIMGTFFAELFENFHLSQSCDVFPSSMGCFIIILTGIGLNREIGMFFYMRLIFGRTRGPYDKNLAMKFTPEIGNRNSWNWAHIGYGTGRETAHQWREDGKRSKIRCARDEVYNIQRCASFNLDRN